MNQSRFSFDRPGASLTGEQRKEAGKQQAADNKPFLLKLAREIAENHPDATTGITADEVVAGLVAKGYSERALGNAAGSLFRGKKWRCVGRRKSKRPHANGNELRVWRLK